MRLFLAMPFAGEFKPVESQKLHLLPLTGAQTTVDLPWLPPRERDHWSDILTTHAYHCATVFQPLGFWYLVVGPLFLIALSGDPRVQDPIPLVDQPSARHDAH